MIFDRGRCAALAACWALLLAVLPLPAAAELSLPPRTGAVVDQANTLDGSQEQALAKRAERIRQDTGTEVVIVTLVSLQRQSIEAWGRALGNGWRVGGAAANGIILIVAPFDREVRIEVGDGVTGRFTDGTAAAIVRNVIIPKFKASDMAGGITAGVQAIADALSPGGGAAQAAAGSGVWQFVRGLGINDIASLLPYIFVALLFGYQLIRNVLGLEDGDDDQSDDDDTVVFDRARNDSRSGSSSRSWSSSGSWGSRGSSGSWGGGGGGGRSSGGGGRGASGKW